MKPQDEKNTKKDYRSPQLLVYGNISDVTRSSSSGMMDDNPSGSMKT
jgi:hypothetical protein